MRREIVDYDPKYRDSVARLIEEFDGDSLKEFGVKLDVGQIDEISKKAKTKVLVIDGEVSGLLSGIIHPMPLSNDKVFQEIIWFVSKKHRKYGILLLKETEKWVKEQGCSHMIMIGMFNSSYDKLFDFYQNTGYKPMESHFIKEL